MPDFVQIFWYAASLLANAARELNADNVSGSFFGDVDDLRIQPEHFSVLRSAAARLDLVAYHLKHLRGQVVAKPLQVACIVG